MKVIVTAAFFLSLDPFLHRPEFGARHCGSLLNTAHFLE